jgi:hypothetical protein
MRLIPHAYNGFLFQQVNKVASDFTNPYDWQIAGISTNNIPRSQNFPKFAAKVYDGDIKVVNVNFTDVDVDRNVLVIAMDVLGDGQHQLLANDELGRSWYVNAVCVGINEESTSGNAAKFGAVFEIDDPIWKLYLPSQETISVDVTGNGTIHPIGNQPSLPIISITPTAAGAFGFKYKRFIQIINNSVNALLHYPLNLNGAGLDTAALVADNNNKCQVNVGGGINAVVTTIPYDTVTGTIPSSGLLYCGTEQISYTGKTGTTSGNYTGCTRGVNGTTAAVHADNAVIYTSKMNANGEDLRIYVNGVEVKRWLQDMNTSATKIWIDWTQPANSNMTLGAAIAGAGDVGTISIENTARNVALMPSIPLTGNVLIGTEIFVYTGVDVGNLQLTGCTRAERQTSAGAHSVADVIKFVTYDVWLYYGNPSISAYVVDDGYKPAIKLTSTNTSWIFEEFSRGFSGKTQWGGGSTGWLFDAGLPYRNTHNSPPDDFGQPSYVMGMLSNGIIYPIPFNSFWTLNQPCGVTTVTASGEKYRAGSAWPTVVFQRSNDGINWTTVWTETTPSAPTAWEALAAHSAVALGATYYYVRFLMIDAGVSPAEAKYHEVADMTLAIDSANVPTITLAAEATALTLNSTFLNAANGLSMTISLVMNIGDTLTVNTKEKTITLADGSNQISSLQNMPVRAEWFPLLPDRDNDITITDAAQVTYVFDYEDRSL